MRDSALIDKRKVYVQSSHARLGNVAAGSPIAGTIDVWHD
jgi:hypothetical protein